MGKVHTGENKGKATQKESIKDHTSALSVTMDYLQDSYSKSVRQQVHAIGHRVVHGKNVGEAKLVTSEIEQLIQDAAALAPLHNPANLQGIIAAKSIFPGQPQVWYLLHPHRLVCTLLNLPIVQIPSLILKHAASVTVSCICSPMMTTP